MKQTKALSILVAFLFCINFGCKQESGKPIMNDSNESVRVDWRLASSFPKGLDTFFGTAEEFCQRVSDLTGGNFKIKTYQPGEIVPALEVLDAVQDGSIEIGQSAGAYAVGKKKALAFDTGVPFGMTPRQQNAWLYEGGGLELLQKAYDDFNVMYFPGGNTGPQMGGWFKKEINNIHDLKGLRMRIPSIGGEVMSRMGVTVQVLAGGDIYPALEQGTIDASEFIAPYDDEKMGFYKVAKNYYYPGWWEPGATVCFYVNKDAWSKLPKAYQHAIEVAAKEANLSMLVKYDSRNADAMKKMVEQDGVMLRKFDDSILNKANEITNQVLDEYAAENQEFSEVYNSWKAFKEKTQIWFSTNGYGMADYYARTNNVKY